MKVGKKMEAPRLGSAGNRRWFLEGWFSGPRGAGEVEGRGFGWRKWGAALGGLRATEDVAAYEQSQLSRAPKAAPG